MHTPLWQDQLAWSRSAEQAALRLFPLPLYVAQRTASFFSLLSLHAEIISHIYSFSYLSTYMHEGFA